MVELDTQPTRSLFDRVQDTRFQVRQILPAVAGTELERVQFDAGYRAIAEKKFHHLIIKAHDLSAPGANILKQTCLALGAEAGVHRGAINCSIDREAVMITATRAQLEKLILKLRPQPFGLKPLAESIARLLQRQRHLCQTPLQVMAILNITPDSFSDGGQWDTPDKLLAHAQRAIDSGADILDVGGESTRPGALMVPEEEELRRVIPVIQTLHDAFPRTPLSIDTRKAAVAEKALDHGATWVNDVSGLTFDPRMKDVVVRHGGPLVLMHSQGSPEVMQEAPQYHDLLGEICAFFYQQIAAFVEAGGKVSQIVLDPGFGFGKTLEHNLELLGRLPEIVSLGFPVLVGTSRKSFLTLGHSEPPVTEREALTAASLAMAVQGGASLIRLHDVHVQMPVVRFLQRARVGGMSSTQDTD